jgi:hypothetical protein
MYAILGLSLVAEEKSGFLAPVWSGDGQKLLMTKDGDSGVYCWDRNQNTVSQITDARGSGYRMNWSSDHTKFAFKLLQPQGQAPVLYDIATNRLIFLSPFSPRCGVPFLSRDGKISFSIDQNLYVLHPDYTLYRKVSLGFYANLCVISPDGQRVAYNDPDDQIWLVSLENQQRQKMTPDDHSYFAPLWSPDSQKLLVSTLSGQGKVILPCNATIYSLDSCENPAWMPDSNWILYTKTETRQEQIVNMDLWQCDYTGTQKIPVTASPDRWEDYGTYDSSQDTFLLYDHKARSLYRASLARSGEGMRLENMNVWEPGEATPVASDVSQPAPVFTPDSLGQMERATKKVLSNVPYIHQVYDTPDWYSGHSACGATSAAMALTYYKLLAHWDCTVSVPYSHISHYGRYVCEKYTYQGYTFNKMTPDPKGKAAYGGYGFICQNNWEDTKGHMAEYFQKHGVSSSVDWSPKWEELRSEIDNGHPMVILNSLTSAGHYILGIGYYTDQHTVVVNDPYGDKDTSGYPSYDGAGATYDWPGYNNGHSNLKTVHCFIYARR